MNAKPKKTVLVAEVPALFFAQTVLFLQETALILPKTVLPVAN